MSTTTPSRAPVRSDAAWPAEADERPQKPAPSLGYRALHLLGSMKLAVVLLVLLGLLTWLGTLAQVERSTFDVQREYFESWFVFAKLPLSWWGNEWFTLTIPLPGAYPVLALLFVNLLVGGMLRLRWSVRNAGVLITHVGIALLLVAGFVKLQFSYSGHLSLFETSPADTGSTFERVHESSLFTSFHDWELALLRDGGETIEERVVPEHELLAARDGVVVLRGDGLPFTVQVHDWLDACQPVQKGPMFAASTPVVDGVFLLPKAMAREREHNTAGCYVTIVTERGERIDGLVWGWERRPFEKQRYPFTFTVDGKRWGLDLRRVVYDLPFTVRLDKFQKSDHPGTPMARDFRSFVTVDEGGSERQVQIYMNTPLRKDGYVLYQTNWGPQQGGGPPWYSVFEVANNPSDTWPLIACIVIAVGLLLHFVLKLTRFLSSSTRVALRS